MNLPPIEPSPFQVKSCEFSLGRIHFLNLLANKSDQQNTAYSSIEKSLVFYEPSFPGHPEATQIPFGRALHGSPWVTLAGFTKASCFPLCIANKGPSGVHWDVREGIKGGCHANKKRFAQQSSEFGSAPAVCSFAAPPGRRAEATRRPLIARRPISDHRQSPKLSVLSLFLGCGGLCACSKGKRSQFATSRTSRDYGRMPHIPLIANLPTGQLATLASWQFDLLCIFRACCQPRDCSF